jgi:hypothetical protein
MTRQEINLRYFTAQPRNKPAACDSGRGAFGVDSRIGGINEVAEVSANAPCCFSEVRAFFGHAREDTEKRGGVRPLFSFRGFAHDPQRVLNAVHQFAPVGSEHLRDFRIRVIPRKLSGLELSVASFTHADDRGRRLSYDPKFALRHVQSLAHRDGSSTCGDQTAPLPSQ